jgi:hypothetical protein
MSDLNPYASPNSDVSQNAVSGDEIARLNRVASGQRIIITSLLVSIVSSMLRVQIGDIAVIISIGATMVSIVGAVRLAGALGRSKLSQVLYGIAMILPLINLIFMLILSSQANKSLRAGGYKIGLLGAKSR